MFRLIVVTAAMLILGFQAQAAVKWNNSKSTPINTSSLELQKNNPIPALSGLGINSMVMWSGAVPDELNPQYFKDNFLGHFENLHRQGFKHIVLVSCGDWIISVSCQKWWQEKDILIKAAKMLLDNTDLHVVVQLKGYKSKKVDGRNQMILYQAIENDNKAKRSFISSWKDIAKQLESYPADRLSFSLLNEPEFSFPNVTKRKRNTWLKIAEDTIREIRTVSPNRVILLEGIGKSLFARRHKKSGSYKFKSPDDILMPIQAKNVIYAFHNYEPETFIKQGTSGFKWGSPYSKKISEIVAKDAKRAIKWANKHKVPIMITEMGCVGFLEGREGPATNDDCGRLAADIKKNYLDVGVGVSWWALEKEKTIFNRNCSNNCWMPNGKLVANKAIFSAFGLKADAMGTTDKIKKPEPKNLTKLFLSKVRKDIEFRKCLLNDGFKEGQLNQVRFQPFASESQVTLDMISKSKCTQGFSE